METTYGDRLHKPLGPSIEEFYDAVTDTFKRGGNVVVPLRIGASAGAALFHQPGHRP